MTMVLAIAAAISACDQSRQSSLAETRQETPPLTSCELVHRQSEAKGSDSTITSVVVPDMAPVCSAELVSVLRLVTPEGEDDLVAWKPISRRSDGLYVSIILGENALAVWDSMGHFVRRIGRSGAGPGEFASAIQPTFGVGDTLYTIDNSRQLSVFDTGFRFVRRSTQLNSFRTPGYTFVTADGRRFVSPPPAGVRTHHVAELDARGEVVNLLVPADPATTGPGVDESERSIAYGAGNSFWIATAQVPAQKYEMEEWSLDGRLLRRVRREAEWFVPHALDDNPDPTAPPSTYFAMLQVDSSGLLHTVISSRERRQPLPPGTRMDRQKRKEGIMVRWEIIDPVSGTLVASTRFSDVDSVPLPFIQHTNAAIILVADDTDDYRAEIVRWRVVPRSAR